MIMKFLNTLKQIIKSIFVIAICMICVSLLELTVVKIVSPDFASITDTALIKGAGYKKHNVKFVGADQKLAPVFIRNTLNHEKKTINSKSIDDLKKYKSDLEAELNDLSYQKSKYKDDVEEVSNFIKATAIEVVTAQQTQSKDFVAQVLNGEDFYQTFHEKNQDSHYLDVVQRKMEEKNSKIAQIENQEALAEPMIEIVKNRIAVIQRALDMFPGAKGAYQPGQCTWGVSLWRDKQGLPIKSNWGNAMDWAGNAKEAGYLVNDEAEEGAVAVFPPGPGNHGYGHVAVVLNVYDNDTIKIWEMNFASEFDMHTRVISSKRPFAYIHGSKGLTIHETRKALSQKNNILTDDSLNGESNKGKATKISQEQYNKLIDEYIKKHKKDSTKTTEKMSKKK